ncbi:hypothetical protein [Arthrobacter sp. NicSoilC12]|uniref:hypothetical protein n=1 Tax=Arthrobacter sp. NicSoilC12 TaxID=2831001 RepID=UPI001CC37FC2|nr:hypothetical protein [Arthrobacter sp. NicSoilC12]GIU57476.1 hypothetical protein NicSoilC12_32250 [Arthrobacter sp. NicSoilC12]
MALLESGSEAEADPVASAAKEGVSFSQQLGERLPDFDLPTEFKRAMSADGQ